MAAAAGLLLLALTLAALVINVYFTTLLLDRGRRLRATLGRLFNACGADTSSCAVVMRTPFARLFGGVPNVALGLAWCAALLPLAVYWIVAGRVVVPWPYLVVAAGTVVVAAYLIHALVVVLKQPCPL
jgi:uncharacterized membrane protein